MGNLFCVVNVCSIAPGVFELFHKFSFAILLNCGAIACFYVYIINLLTFISFFSDQTILKCVS